MTRARSYLLTPLFFVLSVLSASPASAVPIIGLNPSVGEHNAIIEYYSGNREFRTSDGVGIDLGGAGIQPVGYDFQGDLGDLQDLLSGATFSIEDVIASNVESNNGFITQHTAGGRLSLWADANQTDLLLSASINNGQLTGELGAATARFDSSDIDITGGSLADSFPLQLADLFIEVENIQKCVTVSKRCFLSSTPGLGLINGELSPFSSTLVQGGVTGKEGTEVPEPSTALLLLFGVYGGGIVKRRKARMQSRI